MRAVHLKQGNGTSRWACMPSRGVSTSERVPRTPAATLDRVQVLTMPPADVAARLVLLKELLPGSDVARMVELAPG